jgi:hypothetical protein
MIEEMLGYSYERNHIDILNRCYASSGGRVVLAIMIPLLFILEKNEVCICWPSHFSLC